MATNGFLYPSHCFFMFTVTTLTTSLKQSGCGLIINIMYNTVLPILAFYFHFISNMYIVCVFYFFNEKGYLVKIDCIFCMLISMVSAYSSEESVLHRDVLKAQQRKHTPLISLMDCKD